MRVVRVAPWWALLAPAAIEEQGNASPCRAACVSVCVRRASALAKCRKTSRVNRNCRPKPHRFRLVILSCYSIQTCPLTINFGNVSDTSGPALERGSAARNHYKLICMQIAVTGPYRREREAHGSRLGLRLRPKHSCSYVYVHTFAADRARYKLQALRRRSRQPLSYACCQHLPTFAHHNLQNHVTLSSGADLHGQ